jgi:AraC family transcriptional activator of pyochelin receptor
LVASFIPLKPSGSIEHRLDGRVAVHGRHRSFPAPKQRIVLGDGLFCFHGRGQLLDTGRREPAISLTFNHTEGGAFVSVGGPVGDPDVPMAQLVIVATVAACERAFGFAPIAGRWHMSIGLRVITAAITACVRTEAARNLYLRAKSLELACETFEQLRTSSLTPYAGCDVLSEADTRRLMAARAMIEERLREPLTLDGIARACGLNRSKLSRGFRELFGTTVATLISDMRMQRAKDLLLTTDLRIATVGFRSGYRNNASFARAFIRHHGVSPLAARATVTR